MSPFCTLPQSLSNLWNAIKRWMPSRRANANPKIQIEGVTVDPVTVSVTSEATNDFAPGPVEAAPQVKHMEIPVVTEDPISTSNLYIGSVQDMNVKDVKQPYHTWEEFQKPTTSNTVPSSAASTSSRGFFSVKYPMKRSESLDSLEYPLSFKRAMERII